MTPILQMGCPISRQARDRFRLEPAHLSERGSAVFVDHHAARRFARQVVRREPGEEPIQAGALNALVLVQEVLFRVLRLYWEKVDATVLEEVTRELSDRLGAEPVEELLRVSLDAFPPGPVYREEQSPEEHLAGPSEGEDPRRLAWERLILIWLANRNPACGPLRTLFDDEVLAEAGYPETMAILEELFRDRPPFGPESEPLLDLLQQPARESPDSLPGQLEYIRTRWGTLLGDLLEGRLLRRLLAGLDLVREEQRRPGGGGPGEAMVPVFRADGAEIEAFSPDRDWMPRLVLVAKNAFVWLEQLSRRYEQGIHRLDQIPEEELDRLAEWGFTGLWLIGLWERSSASKRIKRLCGNPDAEASAYSLRAYRIAPELGGEEALANLRDRALQRGIRLASDMVPNHMGIDSDWVMEHPDWFVQTPESPFPAYRFEGEDLSDDSRAALRIDDRYYDRSDAAVVFQHRNRESGETRYIYHGNDGTSFPWNDTAQLNYLLPEVREAVIQTILQVARQFPIIRFDAAMTLTRQHYRRLWFPEPGSGGDIPSRADHGLTAEEFDRAMPREFWREVVDRAAAEAPDSLLLAEAFWLLEGFFVRSLGMHRVYNSAFMNMLRDEENAKYRSVIAKTIQFDPEILRRYVSFMNNPDERTAVDQFGSDGKYFAVCTLLATLPGLPMFGHGQVEGLAERYGMEFRRPLWDEKPDDGLIERHRREIFPLLRRRALFAGVDRFRLYDLTGPEGSVEENVLAYSNGLAGERALVVVHNRFAEVRGWIHRGVPFARKDGEGGKSLVKEDLAAGLDLPDEEGLFAAFRDQVTGLEYLRSTRELHQRGLYIELGAFQYHAFLDFRELRDGPDGPVAALAERLAGRGVPSLEEEMREEPAAAPMVTGLNVLAIYGTDLERSRRFYVDLLGLEEAGDMPPGMLLRAGKLTVYLEGGREGTVNPGLERATTSACFATDSVRGAYERLRKAGVPIIEEYREFAPDFAMLRFADPDGNVIELTGKP